MVGLSERTIGIFVGGAIISSKSTIVTLWAAEGGDGAYA